MPATLAPWHAELLFRGQLAAILDGRHQHTDTVIIRFPDQAAADAWHASPAYQALTPLRRQAADLELLTFTD